MTESYLTIVATLTAALEAAYPGVKISLRVSRQDEEWVCAINFFDAEGEIALHSDFTVPFTP